MIEDLAQLHANELKGLISNAEEFSKVVRDNRHYCTHHNPGDLKAGHIVRGGELLRLNEKLKLLFQMCMLAEMGIPRERFTRLQRQLASVIVEYH